tara:strand:- start:184 stop:297 length:114 start_codon:yes stop_codon:yes gene_type:complete
LKKAKKESFAVRVLIEKPEEERERALEGRKAPAKVGQ